MDTLPWIAAIDKFQHWIYLNPNHSIEDRYQSWQTIMNDFGSQIINYNGLENNLKRRWQVQLHLYEVPFIILNMVLLNLVPLPFGETIKRMQK